MDKRTIVFEIPTETIAAAFSQALDAAEMFRGATSPNPPVGCVVLDAAGNVLAVAAHEKAGQPHAEANAIAMCRKARTLAQAHTIVVTLEPCNHTGLTPPCCDAILNSPIRNVWIGAHDPNPNVKGGGISRLRQAGCMVGSIEAISPELHRRSEALLAPFKKKMLTGLPWVTVKQAIDENGSMIPPDGHKTFTSRASLLLAHYLRKRADAMLTGSGTILADNPLYTVRHVADHPGKIRDLMILDRRQRVPQAWLTRAEKRGFRPIVCSTILEALEIAAARGAIEVMVESGPSVTGAILEAGLWDEHYIIHKNGNGPGADWVETRFRQSE